MLTGSLLPQANLQASYKGDSLNDLSGNGKTLTNTNSVGLTPYGFDFGATNTNKELSVANALGLTNASDYSFIWNVKLITEIGSGLQNFFNHVFPTSSYCQTYMDYNAGARRIIAEHGGNQALYTIALGTSGWYQMAQVRSGSSFFLYINGLKRATGIVAGVGAGSTKLTIGSSGGAHYISGIMSHIKVFDTAKTDDQILRIYQDSFGRKTTIV